MLGFSDYKRLIEKLLVLFKEEFRDNLLSLAVFGSVARDEARPLSDIDILVIYRKDNFEPLKKFIHILNELRRDDVYNDLRGKGILADPYPIFLNEDELKSRPWVLLDLIDTSRILYDTEDVLAKVLKVIRERLTVLGAKKKVLPDGTWFWDLKPDWKPGEVIEI